MTTYTWHASARHEEAGWIFPLQAPGDPLIDASVGRDIVERLNELHGALQLVVDTFGPVTDVTDYPEERAALEHAEAVLKKR